jgi:outer membrane protein assembly factor BamB
MENWIPAISNGTVYSGTRLDGVAAISLTTGAVLWDNTSLGMVTGPLSVTSSAVIAAPGPATLARRGGQAPAPGRYPPTGPAGSRRAAGG